MIFCVENKECKAENVSVGDKMYECKCKEDVLFFFFFFRGHDRLWELCENLLLECEDS